MSENRLKELRMKRTTLKGTITRVETFARDPSLDSKGVELVEARRDRLISAFKAYEETQLDILVCDEKDSEDISIVEDKYYSVLALLNKAIKDSKLSETSQSSNISNSKLPNIELSIFSGKDFTQFKPFIELFQALIHNNKSLSNVQKLFYLRKYLCDEALNIIINLPIINDSYDKAIELLNKRYDNKSRLISNHVGLLLDLPEVQKGTAASIRLFISEIQQQLYALQNLEQPIDKWDMILIPILCRKLDSYTLRAYQLDRDCEELPTISGFISFLEQRAIALEDSSPPKFAHKTYNKSTNNKIVNMVINQNCKFCETSSHQLYSCPKFKLASVSQRQTFVNNNNLCQLCMRSHNGKCKLTFKCKVCKKLLHNTLLCNGQKGEQPLQENNTTNTVVDVENSSSIANFCSNSTSNTILIPTVKVKIFDSSGKISVAKAMFDTGSQTSFITDSLVKKLGLSPMAQQTNIISIGNKNNKIYKAVKLNIHSCVHENIKFNIKCHVIDTITTRLPQKYIKLKNFSVPKDIILADDEFHIPSTIDLLLVIGDCNKLENVMQQFWFSEELPHSPVTEKKSSEFQKAEEIFTEAILKHTYVDDVIYGADEEAQLVEIKNQLLTIMGKGGFSLHKWCSNSEQALNDIDKQRKYFSDEIQK
ncbi:uncharacterized protein LOC120632857 [Pararge aegeria]|uniref:uncharacterized protein LOC120632857 n=1 Tax=Pararge aegeria TaxID=116150 RepID=UPI0019CF4FB2|nr:uncharacterized protein LOC120632857 [Pararge aegeria]